MTTPENGNRAAKLADTLLDLAVRIADFDGELSGMAHLWLYDNGGSSLHVDAKAIARVDALASALIGKPGSATKVGSATWQHTAEQEMPGRLKVSVQTMIPPPDEENPAALKARIAELEQQLASGGTR